MRRLGVKPFLSLLVLFLLAGAAEPESLAVRPAKAKQPLVTNVFFESDLVQALADVSAQAKIPIITDGSVGGIVSVELIQTPLDEALGKILYPLGYTFKRMDDYYLVGSGKPESPSFFLLSSSEVLAADYLRAEDAYKLLPDFYKPYLKLNAETNTMTITAPGEIIRKAKEDLASIDRPKKQILIEALVTEISTEATRALGIDWSGTFFRGADTVLRTNADFSRIADTSFGLVVKKLTSRLGDWSYSLVPSIQALAQDGKARIRANPKLVTVEGRAAEIVVGKERYYQIAAGAEPYPYYRLEKIEVGVSMTITPYVAENRDITVVVEPTVSDVVGSGLEQLPIVSKRSVKTKVVVKDGENIVIGGLVLRNEMTVERKIPLLGSIPVIGFLFGHTRKVVDENEVVIVITPHILE